MLESLGRTELFIAGLALLNLGFFIPYGPGFPYEVAGYIFAGAVMIFLAFFAH